MTILVPKAAVEAVQTVLRVDGYYPGASDGAWGAGSQAGLVAMRADAAAGRRARTGEAALSSGPPASRNLTEDDIRRAAADLGASYAQLRAVDEVESGGGWFKDVRSDILGLDGPGGFLDGPDLPKILFEAHIFSRLTQRRFNASHPNLSSTKWNRALYVGGQGEYARLYKALQLDHDAALKSASWGRYQIMGFNHQAAGHATVDSFVDAMKAGEGPQLAAFCAFIRAKRLAPALKSISADARTCVAFAAGYNGEAYDVNDYDGKLARAFQKWSA